MSNQESFMQRAIDCSCENVDLGGGPFGAVIVKDGKIIAVLTTAQYESKNIGDACADASFYTQFNGKTEADYSDIEAISGATITTNGYKTAIGKVFEAVKIMEGVA